MPCRWPSTENTGGRAGAGAGEQFANDGDKLSHHGWNSETHRSRSVEAHSDAGDDFEVAATKERLRRKLGDQCTDKIIGIVLEAEKSAVLSREALADMLDKGILEASEYADKVNRVAAALLREVGSLLSP